MASFLMISFLMAGLCMAVVGINREYLTPPEVGALTGVGHDKVLGWIRTGELPAVNLATRVGGRPRWRISRDDLASFLARRAATPPPKPTRRRKRQSSSVTEFY